LTIFKIIESDKFISFKNDFINKCLENITNNMDSELRIEDNISNHQNTINVPNRNRLEITRNITSDNNSITVRDNRNSLSLHQVNIENYNVGTQTVNNDYNTLLTNNNNENELLNNSLENLLNNDENELLNNSQEDLLNNNIIKNSSSSKLKFKDKINQFINKSKSDTNLRIKNFNFLSQDLKGKSINKDFPLLKENLLRLLPKELITLSDYFSLINYQLGKLPFFETKLEHMSIYIDLFYNIEDFKNIQKCLLDIKDLNKIEILLDQCRIGYFPGSKRAANSKFIVLLHRMLINERLLFVSDLFVFKEYYVLNDLDYLNYINKNKIIDLRIYSKLNRSLELNNILIETLNLEEEDLKLKSLLTNYNSKVLDFYNHFDIFTLDDYNRKYEKNLPVINIRDIKKSREIDFFEILFKK